MKAPWSKSFIMLAIVALLPIWPGTLAGQKTREYKAQSVRVLQHSATMRYRDDYWVTTITGVAGKDGIPQRISVGDTIHVGDRALTANYIFVTECLVTLEWAGNVLCDQGQVQCLVVERLEDVASDSNPYRLWITVDRCRPIDALSDGSGKTR